MFEDFLSPIFVRVLVTSNDYPLFYFSVVTESKMVLSRCIESPYVTVRN